MTMMPKQSSFVAHFFVALACLLWSTRSVSAKISVHDRRLRSKSAANQAVPTTTVTTTALSTKSPKATKAPLPAPIGASTVDTILDVILGELRCIIVFVEIIEQGCLDRGNVVVEYNPGQGGVYCCPADAFDRSLIEATFRAQPFSSGPSDCLEMGVCFGPNPTVEYCSPIF